MIQKFKNFYYDYYPFLVEYILMSTFTSFILFKVNNILFNLPFFYVFFSVIFITIVFKNFFFQLANKIKNLYVFNFLLYYNLVFKNFIYKCFFDYDDRVTFYKYRRLHIFFTTYMFTFIFLHTFLYILFNLDPENDILKVSYSFILLLISLLNLIEKKFIFNVEKDINIIENFDYKYIQNILKIKNDSFNKNHSFSYIQRRYFGVAASTVNKEAIKQGTKKAIDFGVPSAVAAIGTLGYYGWSVNNGNKTLKTEQDKMAVEQDKLAVEQRKLALEQDKLAVDLELKKKEFINQTEKEIFLKKKEIEALKDDEINSSTIFHKKTNSNQIKILEEQKEYYENILKNSEKSTPSKNLDNELHVSNCSNHTISSEMFTNYIKKSSIEDFFI